MFQSQKQIDRPGRRACLGRVHQNKWRRGRSLHGVDQELAFGRRRRVQVGGPGAARNEGAGREGDLAALRDDRPPGDAVMPGAGNLGADFGIDRGGGADGGAAGLGQKGNAADTGRVKRTGGVQHPLSEQAYAGIRFAQRGKTFGCKPGVAQPVGGQVAAPGPRILADIARNVSQLHRQA